MADLDTRQRDRYVRMVRSGDWARWDPERDIWPTLGPAAVEWCGRNLIHGPGDLLGEPLTFRDDQQIWLAHWFEYDPLGRERKIKRWWRYLEALKGEARGGVKTELAAALVMLDLSGPPGIRHRAPDIAVAAVSLENAGQLFSVVQAMTGGRGETGVDCPLKGAYHVHDTEVLPKEGVGRAYRVAAEAKGQQGGRPSLVVIDEVHELTGAREDIITVLTDGAGKKIPPGRWMMITTAGAEAGSTPPESTDSYAWRLYCEGLRQRDEPGYRPEFFFDWREANPELDTTTDDPAVVEQGVREASGGADVSFSVARRVSTFLDPTRNRADSIRYFWNRWPTVSGRNWLSDTPTAWAACADRDARHAAGQQVWLGLDGAHAGDSAAVATVGAVDGGRWLWTVRVFNADAHGRRGVAWDQVRAHIDEQLAAYQVQAIAYDPTLVTQFMAELEASTGVTTIEVPQSLSRRSRIDEWARTSIVAGTVAHRADPTLARHVGNAQWRVSGDARVLSKRASGRKIDALIAAAMAHWYATSPDDGEPARAPLVVRTVSSA